MVRQTIQIFLRFRPPPHKKAVTKYNVHQTSKERPCVTLDVNREVREYDVCNKKELYNFQFDAIFDVFSGQDQVFDAVAKPVIEKALEGYNGTIFAYGQTGSGKTFTITGGAEKYTDRGIIPRTIEYIFRHFEENVDVDFQLKISYLEIYNENGYDLLNAKHDTAKRLEDLPRVTLFEDTDAGTVHLKNLSIHPAMGIDEALNLLFMGDTNRMIAETPTNEASSRSHCIFTLHIASRLRASQTVRRAKLHLVDLAGSERVYKSGIDGTTLTEAKYINLSLHYLEQVIVALSEKQRSHVPYRNSMMTMILRDSLGGNCLTSMIANCSSEQDNVHETISTCRFAQRVALIKNEVLLNEEQDPHVIIRNLKDEIGRLKAELALATGNEREDELIEEEKERCELMVTRFLATDPGNEKFIFPIEVFSDVRKIYFCLSMIQELHQREVKELKSAASRLVPKSFAVPTLPSTNQEVEELRALVAQRDHEIHVLIDLLKRGKTEDTEVKVMSTSDRAPQLGGNNTRRVKYVAEETNPQNEVADNVVQWLEEGTKQRLLGQLSVGREQAFELFKRDYASLAQIETQKAELRTLYGEAKKVGKEMCSARDEITQLQTKLNELIHMEPENRSAKSESFEALQSAINAKQTTYRSAYLKLKELRPRIEHLQHLLETAKVRLVKDFESWWQSHQQHQHSSQRSSTGASEVRSISSHQHSIQPTNSTGQLESRNNVVTDDSSTDTIPGNELRVGKATASLPIASPVTARQSTFNEATFGKIPLTGDPVVDTDILAFVHAREKIRRRQIEQDDR